MGQRFTEMGQKCQNMPFLGQIGHFGQKLHIFYFFTHSRKYYIQLLYTIGISKVFEII